MSFFLAFFNTTEAEAQTTRLGILPHQAPSWEVSEWLQLPRGKASLDINDVNCTAKVLSLYCSRKKEREAMPELPEVETIRRGLETRLVGQTITGVRVRQFLITVAPEMLCRL